MLKRFFLLACLSLAILPSCNNNGQNSGDTTDEESQYKEKISYSNGMVTRIDLCDYEKGLRTSTHSKLYGKTGRIQAEIYEENEYNKKQIVRSNSTLTDYTDDPVQITTSQTVNTYDSYGNMVHSVAIATYSDESLTAQEVAAEYKYDSRGNVLEETIYERKSGSGKSDRGYIQIEGHRTVISYDKHDRVVNSLRYQLDHIEYDEPQFTLTDYTHCTYEKNQVTSLIYYYDDMSNNNYKPIRKAIITESYNNSKDLIERSEYSYNAESQLSNIIRSTYEYGQNHCLTHEINYSTKSGSVRIDKEVYTSYLNNNPNKILTRHTFVPTQSSSLVNEYDSKGRIIKSTTRTASKSSQIKVQIYRY